MKDDTLNVCRPLPGLTAEVQAYDVAVALSKLFDNALGFQMENLLRHLLLLLIEADLSLVEAPRIIQDEILRGVLAQRSGNPLVKEFFLRTFPGVPQSSKDALLTRLQGLLLPENLRLMLGANELIDFKGVLDRGNPLVMFLGKGPGVPEEQVEVLGSLLLQLVFQGAFASGSGQRQPYQIILDEFFHLLEAPTLYRRFETGLTSLRSFGVTLALAMHNFSQVPRSLQETIQGNCDLIALFRTSSRNAQYFGEFLPETDPESLRESLRTTGRPPGKFDVHSRLLERLQRLPDRHCYWYDRRKPYRAVLVRVRDVQAPHESIRISAKALDEFIDAHGVRTGGFGQTKESLRHQIDAREKSLKEMMNPPIYTTDSPREGAKTTGMDKGKTRSGKRVNLG